MVYETLSLAYSVNRVRVYKQASSFKVYNWLHIMGILTQWHLKTDHIYSGSDEIMVYYMIEVPKTHPICAHSTCIGSVSGFFSLC